MDPSSGSQRRLERSRNLLHRLPAEARLLLIRLRSMGDCLLLTSPVRALKAQFPSFRIAVLVEKRFADVFDGNPDFDQIIRVQDKAATVARLFTRRFDLVLNLHGGPTSLVYARSARGLRVGGEHYQHAWGYRATFPRPNPNIHTVASTLELFQWLGVHESSPPPLRYERHPDASDQVRARLTDVLATPTEPYVVVHPAAVMDTKRWPVDRFALLARWLGAQGLRVVLTCGPAEEPLVAAIERKVAGVLALPGLSIPELAELIRGARCYVGNDSGPMHLATAVGTPTVAIWGSSSSVRWHPWGVDQRVVQNPFTCNPCPGYRCLVADSPLCIESVTVAQVQEAVRSILHDA
jgi:ADP-heptose:LPS heptosyltransferase